MNAVRGEWPATRGRLGLHDPDGRDSSVHAWRIVTRMPGGDPIVLTCRDNRYRAFVPAEGRPARPAAGCGFESAPI